MNMHPELNTWLATLSSCVFGLSVLPVFGEDPAALGIQMHSGLILTGQVGTVYSIQCTEDISHTNWENWRCLAFVQQTATNQTWWDREPVGAGQRFYRAAAEIRSDLVFVPPGSFRMGSPTGEVDHQEDESPQPTVTISRGFWMAKHEVTQGEYLAVMGNNPSQIKGDTYRPVETVSWFDADSYCAALTALERAANRIPANSVYRLPTEAEWEYACRAWTSTRFYYGDDPGFTKLRNYAWYADSSGGASHPVGQKLPNAWGLYDMHGNVAEWCQDWYGPYPSGWLVDPQGPKTGSQRVLRGASWRSTPGWMDRSAQRMYDPPDTRYIGYGFRVVLAASEP